MQPQKNANERRLISATDAAPMNTDEIKSHRRGAEDAEARLALRARLRALGASAVNLKLHFIRVHRCPIGG
jgi:hypothetical protein